MYGFYGLFLVVRGIVVFAQEQKQSLEVVDDTHTQRYPHNHSIKRGLRAAFDAHPSQEGRETGENTNPYRRKGKFKLQNHSHFFPVQHSARSFSCLCRESSTVFACARHLCALWDLLLEGMEVGGLLLRESCVEIQLSL